MKHVGDFRCAIFQRVYTFNYFHLAKKRWHLIYLPVPTDLPISSQRNCFCLSTFTADVQLLPRVCALSLIAARKPVNRQRFQHSPIALHRENPLRSSQSVQITSRKFKVIATESPKDEVLCTFQGHSRAQPGTARHSRAQPGTAPQSTWSSTLRHARSSRVASVRRFPRRSKVVRLSRSNSVALSVLSLL